MGNTSSSEKAKSMDRRALNNFSQDVMFDFLHGERIRKVLERTYKLALNEEPRTSIPLLKYLIDRYFGRPIQLQKNELIQSTVTVEDIMKAFDSDLNDNGL